jgi:hypothetical protein
MQRQFGVEIDPPQRVFDGAELAVRLRAPGKITDWPRYMPCRARVGALVEQFRRRAGIRCSKSTDPPILATIPATENGASNGTDFERPQERLGSRSAST